MLAPSLAAILGLISIVISPAQEGRTDQPTRELLEPPTRPTPYSSFEGHERELFAWPGEHVVFLTRSAQRDPVTMTRLVEVFDGVHAFYRAATGREPQPSRQIDGRLTIAEEPETCGAGCGYLGQTGIELTPLCFDQLYETLRADGRIDQALPYEFGRNFWFYGDRLEYAGGDNTGSITTGYAVLMRFWALEAVGCRVAAFRAADGDAFLSEVEGLAARYEGDRRATWKRTLRVGRGVESPLGLGATDLFASFLMAARAASGQPDFVTRIWRYAGLQPAARSTEEAVDNLVVAASLAAGRDLGQLFEKRWHFPVSRAAGRRIATGLEAGLGPDGARPIAAMAEGGLGCFVFEAALAPHGGPVRVWYRVPERLRSDAPVVFVMHGMSRNADTYRDSWADWARKEKVVLLVPEFSDEHYPDSRAYNQGNRFDDQGRPLAPEHWTFTTIECVFDAAVSTLGLSAKDYALYGHSAGAQFVHRMVLCLPDARMRTAVAANAGWYTLPQEAEAWPYGLAGSGLDESSLERAFGRRLCILLGERDIDENDDNLRKTPEAMRQGRNRLERGRHFFERARRLAEERRWTFRWELDTVPGVGHSNSGMQPAAGRLLEQ